MKDHADAGEVESSREQLADAAEAGQRRVRL